MGFFKLDPRLFLLSLIFIQAAAQTDTLSLPLSLSMYGKNYGKTRLVIYSPFSFSFSLFSLFLLNISFHSSASDYLMKHFPYTT